MNGAGEEIRTLDIDLGKTSNNAAIRATTTKNSHKIYSQPKNHRFSVGVTVDFLWIIRKRLKCRLLDVYADLWRRRALLMAAGVSSPARFGPYSTRAFIASVR